MDNVAVHVKVNWTRIASAAEDVAVCTFDLEGPDVDAVTAVTVDTRFVTWWTAIADRFTPRTILREVRFYNGYNGDGSPGDVDFVIPHTLPGSATGDQLPPQCACSVTEELYEGHLRRNWGRFYLPAPAVSQVDPDGRFDAIFLDDVVNATQALYNGLFTDGWTPIVWVAAAGGGQAVVDGLRVDDIVDIQRRRRWDTFVTRMTRDLATT